MRLVSKSFFPRALTVSRENVIFASPWLKHLQRFGVLYLSQVTTDCTAVVLRGDETRGSYMHTIQASVSAAGRSLVQVC
jgi:hypothetical protein